MASISLKYKSKNGNLTAPGNADPGAMIPIATAIIGSGGDTSVTFSNIPASYEHLQLRLSTKGRTAGLTGACVHRLRFNDDSSTSYTYHQLRGNGSSAGAEGGTASSNGSTIGYYPAGGETASAFGVIVCDILDYTNTNKYKTVRGLGGWDGNGSGYSALNSGVWLSTAAINTILVTCDDGLRQYSRIDLFGIKRAGA